MSEASFQLQAPGDAPLERVVREGLIAEGLCAQFRPPSRKRVRDWIRAGDVAVEGRPIPDPAFVPRAGDRVVVTPGGARPEIEKPGIGAQGAACGAGQGVSEPGAGAGCAASIRHLDAHLLVVEWTPPHVVGTDPAVLTAWLRAGLEASGVKGSCPRPVPDPVLRVGGLVAAALTPRAEARLGAAQADREVHLDLTALVETGSEADTSGLAVSEAGPGVVRVGVAGARDVAHALEDLRTRGLQPLPEPGSGPSARRPLLAHVTGLALPHPSTGRRLSWASPLPPALADGNG